ncbi:hypothetical protein D3C76_1733960 [compost metagenome]
MYDDLVTWIQGGRQGFKDDLLTTRASDHFIDGVIQAVVPRQLGHDGLAKSWSA